MIIVHTTTPPIHPCTILIPFFHQLVSKALPTYHFYCYNRSNISQTQSFRTPLTLPYTLLPAPRTHRRRKVHSLYICMDILLSFSRLPKYLIWSQNNPSTFQKFENQKTKIREKYFKNKIQPTCYTTAPLTLPLIPIYICF